VTGSKTVFFAEGLVGRVQTLTIDVNIDWDRYAKVHRKDRFTCIVWLGYDDVKALLFAA
jgi:hypothetical protein